MLAVDFHHLSFQTKQSGVYAIVCRKSGKMYVGSTVRTFVGRWKQHIKHLTENRHHSRFLQRAFNKYGAENFHFSILAALRPTDCLAAEQFFINLFNSSNFRRGFNMSPTAGNLAGYKHSAKSKANMKAAAVKNGALRRGSKASFETKVLLSQIKKEAYNNIAARQRLSAIAKLNKSPRVKGVRNGKTKLSEATVVEVWRRLKAGEKQRNIAKTIGITENRVCAIKIGRAWGWLTATL